MDRELQRQTRTEGEELRTWSFVYMLTKIRGKEILRHVRNVR